MNWNLGTDWIITTALHEERLEQARFQRLIQEIESQHEKTLSLWYNNLRSWVGHQMIGLGCWLVDSPNAMQLKPCQACE